MRTFKELRDLYVQILTESDDVILEGDIVLPESCGDCEDDECEGCEVLEKCKGKNESSCGTDTGDEEIEEGDEEEGDEEEGDEEEDDSDDDAEMADDEVEDDEDLDEAVKRKIVWRRGKKKIIKKTNKAGFKTVGGKEVKMNAAEKLKKRRAGIKANRKGKAARKRTLKMTQRKMGVGK